MDINIKDVENIAELARLELSPEEKQLYSGQLKNILGWIEELNKADTAGTAPTAHILGLENVLREDTPAPFADRQAILNNAPEREFDFVKVRKVIE